MSEDNVAFEMPTLGTHVEKVNYPDLSTIVPPAQYIQLDDVQRQNLNGMLFNDTQLTREQFLIKYHKTAILQFGIFLGLTLLGAADWFSSILVKMNYYYYNSYYDTSFEDYKRWYGYENSSYRDYYSWRDDQQYKYTSFRWTFFVVIALLGLSTLTISLGRTHPCIIKCQKKLFMFQSILGGLLFAGILGIDKDSNWGFCNKLTILISTFVSLIANGLLNIILTKFKKLHYYGKLSGFIIYGSLVVNFIVATESYYMEKTLPIVEAIIVYGLYYYNQLNLSLLQDPKELPEVSSVIEKVQQIVQFTQQLQADQVQIGQDYIVINKKFAIYSVSFVLFVVSIVLCFTIGSPTFIILGVVSISSLIGLPQDTQVASRTLSHDDQYIAVCLTPIDILNPIKNFCRSLKL